MVADVPVSGETRTPLMTGTATVENVASGDVASSPTMFRDRTR